MYLLYLVNLDTLYPYRDAKATLREVNHKVNKTVMFTNKNQYISPQIYDGTIN